MRFFTSRRALHFWDGVLSGFLAVATAVNGPMARWQMILAGAFAIKGGVSATLAFLADPDALEKKEAKAAALENTVAIPVGQVAMVTRPFDASGK